ncbi:MAG: hypothetical protein CK531_11395 [Gemmatimonadetes bacterium]|nr:MAG: hypothetical protein CK531_11395 [Gemmatimonadota bacterium]
MLAPASPPPAPPPGPPPPGAPPRPPPPPPGVPAVRRKIRCIEVFANVALCTSFQRCVVPLVRSRNSNRRSACVPAAAPARPPAPGV